MSGQLPPRNIAPPPVRVRVRVSVRVRIRVGELFSSGVIVLETILTIEGAL